MARLFSTGYVSVAVGFCALVPIVGSCADDPVDDMAVAALGDEVPNIPPGPYHRAGQPCSVCHGGQGPASTVFSMAGTVFNANGAVVGADNVQICSPTPTGRFLRTTP